MPRAVEPVEDQAHFSCHTGPRQLESICKLTEFTALNAVHSLISNSRQCVNYYNFWTATVCI